jgi:ATP-dependent Clp protease ATP-binding subunit ClpA
MTNRITEELLTGVVNDSNIDTISTCKFLRYCLRQEYEENIEFLKSRKCDVDFLKDSLDDHIEVEDTQLEIFSQVRNIMSKRGRGRMEATMTPDLKKILDVAKRDATKDKREMFFEDILNGIYELGKNDEDMYALFFLKKSGYKHDPHSGSVAKGKYKFIAELCEDLSEKAAKRRIDPLIGRRKEVERMVEILAHYKKKNPMLIGKPGVGKTAVVEGLASLIQQRQVPELLHNAKIYSLNVGMVLAGSKFRGEFEDKIKGVLSDFKKMKEKEGLHPILFVDEVHQVIGAGTGGSKEGVDLANMIKPGLANGELSCIGATTEDEFNSKITKDKALTRRFQEVKIEEPSAEETLRILTQGIKPVLEDYHDVKYSKKVLERIVYLSGQYITTQFFPDKAISVMDSVGARLRTTVQNRNKATIKDVEEIISTISGTPVSAFKLKKGKNQYIDIESNIKEVIYGQDEAIHKVVEQVELSKAGFKDEGQPIGSFLLLGPTGTGKTELAKQIAGQTESHFYQINMSEFSEEHAVAKLFGAPPGYEGHEEGGMLTNEIMKYPHTILLLDEIEKAHKKVYDALLGIIDGARMTDGRDNVVDFSNVLILMTSNAGAAAAARTKAPMGLGVTSKDEDKAKTNVLDKILKDTFAPEFRNKLTGILMFNSLTEDIMIKIVEKFLNITQIKMFSKGILLDVSDEAKALLAKNGYDPTMGARPIKREIDVNITKKLVKPILKGDLASGYTVSVTVENDELKLDFVEPQPKIKKSPITDVINNKS